MRAELLGLIVARRCGFWAPSLLSFGLDAPSGAAVRAAPGCGFDGARDWPGIEVAVRDCSDELPE